METTVNSASPAGMSRRTVKQNLNRSPLFRGLTKDGRRAFAQEALDQSYLVRQLAAVRNGLPDTGQRNVIEDVDMEVEAITAANSSTSSTKSTTSASTAQTTAPARPKAGPVVFKPEPLPPLWPVIRNALVTFAIAALITYGAFKLWGWWNTPTTPTLAGDKPCIVCETDEDLDEYIRSLDLTPLTDENGAGVDWRTNE